MKTMEDELLTTKTQPVNASQWKVALLHFIIVGISSLIIFSIFLYSFQNWLPNVAYSNYIYAILIAVYWCFTWLSAKFLIKRYNIEKPNLVIFISSLFFGIGTSVFHGVAMFLAYRLNPLAPNSESLFAGGFAFVGTFLLSKIHIRKTFSTMSIFQKILAAAVFIIATAVVLFTPFGKPVDTSNWKYFSNDIIEFNYPGSWQITNTGKEVGGFELVLKDQNFDSGNRDGQWYGNIGFWVKNHIAPNNVDDYAVSGNYGKNLYDDPFFATTVSNWQTLAVDGHRAARFDTKEIGSGRFSGQNLYGSNIFIDCNDYVIATWLKGLGSSMTDIIHQIYQTMKFKNCSAPQLTTSSSLDTSTWKQLDNALLTVSYPSDWTTNTPQPAPSGNQRFDIVDQNVTRKLSVSIINRGNLQKIDPVTNNDYNAFFKKTSGGSIKSESDIQIAGLSAKSYDFRDATDQRTQIVLITQNYIYIFYFYPSTTDDYLSKILNTVKIKTL